MRVMSWVCGVTPFTLGKHFGACGSNTWHLYPCHFTTMLCKVCHNHKICSNQQPLFVSLCAAPLSTRTARGILAKWAWPRPGEGLVEEAWIFHERTKETCEQWETPPTVLSRCDLTSVRGRSSSSGGLWEHGGLARVAKFRALLKLMRCDGRTLEGSS